MNKQNIGRDNDQRILMKVLSFRFPHIYKKIGLIAAILAMAFLILSKFYGSTDPLIKDLCRTIMLLFLLLASLSNDMEEDEYVQHIRSQSYIIAFVLATAYSIGIPLITFVMDTLITKIRNEGTINFHEVSAFEVMFMLICFQLLFFETLKRLGRAE